MQQLVNRWEQLTFDVLNKKEISLSALQPLLTETYAALLPHHQNPLVPKEVVALFSEMESFLYFAFLMEEKEVETNYYHFCLVNGIISYLKEGFLKGSYREEFPKVVVTQSQNQQQIINLETQSLRTIAQ